MEEYTRRIVTKKETANAALTVFCTRIVMENEEVSSWIDKRGDFTPVISLVYLRSSNECYYDPLRRLLPPLTIRTPNQPKNISTTNTA